MNAETPCTIYALSDPRKPTEIRYIGKTKRLLRERLALHVFDVKRYPHCYRSCWIAKLLRDGIRPIIWPLEMTSNWEERERYWIAFLKPLGKLTNLADGGEGVSGVPHTAAQKANLSEKMKAYHRMHPEIAARHTERMRSFKMPEYAKAILRSKAIGRLHSQATKQRLSLIRKGKPKTPAQMAAMQLPKVTWRQVVCVETGKIYESVAAANRAHGVGTVRQAIDHPKWKSAGYHWKFLTAKDDACPDQLP